MFFNLFNILAIFQRYINKILPEKFNIIIIMNLDNTLIYI